MTSDPPSEPTDGDLRDRVEALSVPLGGTDPAADVDAERLAPFREAAGGATIVAMGEATHGTREFYRLRHRLTRHLVEEAGFRVVALETNVSATTPLDDYVAGSEGDPTDLLATEHLNWPYRCEAVVELLEWIRAFNGGRDPDDRVRVYGLDVDSLFAPFARLESFLALVDALDGFGDDLATMAAAGRAEPPEGGIDDPLERARDLAGRIRDRFDSRGDEFVDAASDAEFREASRHLDAVEKSVALFGEDGDVSRDEAMADSLDWIRDHESVGGDPVRAVVWAHDSHVKRGAVGGPWSDADAMGEYLARRHGDDYCALATEFGRGSARVIATGDGEDYEFDVHEFGPPEDGSIPGVFEGVPDAPFFLDLDRAAGDAVLGEWLADRPRRHLLPATVRGDGYVADALIEDFDGLLFVGSSTPTTPAVPLFPSREG